MTAYNGFGATAADIYELFPNADATTFGGETAVNNSITRCEARVLGVIPERQHRLLSHRVELECLASPAAGGETAFSVGLTPANDASVRMHRYGYFPSEKPGYADFNMTEGTDYTVASGAITVTNALSLGEYLFATYTVAANDVAFSWELYKNVIVYLAGYELGDKTFTIGQESYKLVEDYKDIADSWMDMIQDGTMVPQEVRELCFWEDITPVTKSAMSTARKYRA